MSFQGMKKIDEKEEDKKEAGVHIKMEIPLSQINEYCDDTQVSR